MSELTQAELKEDFSYDADTGDFFWVKPSHGRRMWKQPGSVQLHSGLPRRTITVLGKKYLSYRLAWLYVTGSFPTGVIDHRNGNTLDDRFSNLRDVTNLINQQNQARPQMGNKCGFLGVFFDKSRDKFVAKININKKQTHIGYYETAERAADAYFNAKFLLHEGMINERFDA